MGKTRLNAVERDLVEGLEGFLADLKADTPLQKKYTCRRVKLELKPRKYTPQRVKATRRLLNASQALFAQFLGVSVKSVRAWEGGKAPSGMACRFMDEIERNPKFWLARLQESVRVRAS